MIPEHPWTALPAIAATSRDVGRLLRTARTAAGLTLEEVGRLVGCSAATISRWETGRRRAWTVAELRRLAEIYRLPPDLLGLVAPHPPAGGGTTRVDGATDDSGGDWMRRRNLIAGAVGLTAAAALPEGAAAADAPGTVEDVIFGRVAAAPLPAEQLAAQVAAAGADFRACRYAQLARRVPGLLARAEATRAATTPGSAGRAATQLAQAYGVAARLMLKLHDDGMAWATADRAVQAARSGTDPVVSAEAARLTATVLRRRGQRDGAQRLVLRAAQQLEADTGLARPVQVARYGELLAVAAYTAAMRDDRDTAWTLLGAADDATRRAGSANPGGLSTVDVDVYRISVARVLGDYGSAVDYARRIDPARITAPERRARYWQDTALALHGRGRAEQAFAALLAAERDTPQEVRYRPWAQQLTRQLLAAQTRNGLPGLRDFAHRVGAA
ncbi:helix-turn-helix domain-containing protein [Dactylosporangium sp. NPDC051541]|uniref:helix-turn-helix domain-containing protein n=1 Tax=Dactylosporangium sp. NPDC051541 TaxID=3363977 RepID=UPI0037A91A39